VSKESAKPLYVAYYTPAYAGEADELVDTLKAHDLPYEVRLMQDRGQWVLNCGQKPWFIAEMRRAYPNRPLVYLDADARVRQRPSLFDVLGDIDLAVHYRRAELLSGTIYIGATDTATDLIERWAKECRAHPGSWDQRVLQKLVDEDDDLDVYNLPASYTRIFDATDMGEPIVIEHMQASRRLGK
jgi:hypothetical protein